MRLNCNYSTKKKKERQIHKISLDIIFETIVGKRKRVKNKLLHVAIAVLVLYIYFLFYVLI